MHAVLTGILENKRIASAYLFVGPPGSAKSQNAQEFAERLGCREVDRVRVVPDGASVKIDQIREIQSLVRYGPASSPYLVVAVEQADTLTDQAAAAFLKTLEEPMPKVVFILLVEREEKLSATIHSRCQKILFADENKEWLPKPEMRIWYNDLNLMREKSILERFEFSARLEKEKEKIEELLYDLVFYARYELKNMKWVGIMLEAIKSIKKRANLKLVLDVACLKMGEPNKGWEA